MQTLIERYAVARMSDAGGAGGGAADAGSAGTDTVAVDGAAADSGAAAAADAGFGGSVLGGEDGADAAATEAVEGAETGDKADDKKAETEVDPDTIVPEGDAAYALPEDLPEGVAGWDEDLLAALSPLAKANGITQGEFKKGLPVVAAMQKKATEDYVNQVKQWGEAGKADPEIGGAKYDQTVADGRAALKEYGTPELREYLFQSGQGNHPELLRLCARFGAALREGGGPNGGEYGKKTVSFVDQMYPDPVK